MTAPCDKLTTQHYAVLARLAAGENPQILPLMRKKLRRMGLIVPTAPPRAIRTKPGKQSTPPPRQHMLTVLGEMIHVARIIATWAGP